MKNLLLVFTVAAIICSGSSCKVYPPVFKSVSNVHFDNLDNKGIKLGADANFNNPNKIKAQVTDLAMDVLLDGKKVGTVGEKSTVEIRKKSDFTIPLSVSIKPEASLMQTLQTLIGFFTDKDMNLQLQGDVQVKVAGFKFHVPIKHGQKIKLSQLKK